jgi:long-subunit fatty acid transport protein
VRGDLSLFGQVSWGEQKKAAIFNTDLVLRDAQWWGLSGTAAYKFTPRLEGVVRADYIDNKKNGGGLLGYSFDDSLNGIGRGLLEDGSFAKAEDKGANRYALTFGMNYRVDENSTFKIEYRYDGSDQPVFLQVKDGTYKKSNHLFGASMVVSF